MKKFGVLLGCLFGLLSVWYWTHKTPSIQINHAHLNNLTDQQITDLRVKVFNNEGKLLHAFSSALVTHTPQADQHWFQEPHVLVLEPNQPAWEISAKEAVGLHHLTSITFKNNVRLKHLAYKNQPEGLIQTSSLCYYPQQKLAATTEKITWIQAGNKIESQGMKAFLDTHQIDLTQAKVRYASLD